MEPEDIEAIIVDGFSIDLLIPTTQFTFKELDYLNNLKCEQPDNIQIDRRLAAIKRILKLISKRLAGENLEGTQYFLEQLYRNKIMQFNELPASVQYLINTLNMADDVASNLKKYNKALSRVKSPMDALVYLKCFKRAAPVLVDKEEWKVLLDLTAMLNKVSSASPFNTDQVHLGLIGGEKQEKKEITDSQFWQSLPKDERAQAFIFKNISEKLIRAFEQAENTERVIINDILDGIGAFGVDVISKMLVDSSDREVRKLSFERLVQKGEQARKWAADTLSDSSRVWYIHRNAMMILAKVSDNAADFEYVRPLLDHSNNKIREESLNALVALRPSDSEYLVIKALNDNDAKVRWRALRALENLMPISEDAIHDLLNIIAEPLPKDKDLAGEQISKSVQIISAINAMDKIPIRSDVEKTVIECVKAVIGDKSSLWSKVKRAMKNSSETTIVKAAIPLLGKVGGEASKKFLKKLNRSYPDLAEQIKKAMQSIN
jgi:HEAT repeat protein